MLNEFCLNKYYLGRNMVRQNSHFLNSADHDWDMRYQYKENLNTEGIEFGISTHY